MKTIKKVDFIIIGTTTFKKGFITKNNSASKSFNSNIFKNFDYFFGKKVKKLCNYYQEWVKLDVIRNN